MAKKILCVLRVSTDQQEIDSQKSDMMNFLTTKYSEDEIEWLEAEGASAIKVDAKYLKMLVTIKTTISNSSTIKAVAFWSLNRLGRKKTYLDTMVNWFRDNHIQLYTKVPELTLLNDDYTTNPSATLVLSVFSAMIENETLEIQEKTKRGREYKKKEGKWLGGNLKYGFKVVNGKIEPDEEKMEFIKEIYKMYASGNYSYRTLYNELQSLGKEIKYNTLVTLLQSNRREIYKSYVGEYNHTPQLSRGSKHENLTIGLLKCPNCGCSYTNKNGVYRCVHQVKQFAYSKCDAPAISAKNLDMLIKDVTYMVYQKYLKDSTKEEKEILKKENVDLQLKIDIAQQNILQCNQKIKRIKELYIDGEYTRIEFNNQKQKVEKEIIEINSNIEIFQNKIQNNNNIINSNNVFQKSLVIDKSIINKFLSKIEIDRISKYVFTIKIYSIKNELFEFEYNCKKWKYTSTLELHQKIREVL